MAQEKQLSTITEGKGAIPFSPKVNTSTVYDENGQPLNVVLQAVNGKFKECSHSIGQQREKTDGLQDTINEAALHNGEVQAAVLVNIASGTGLTSVNAQQAFAEIAREIYPVQVTIAESNAGTFEIGTRKTPHIVLSILRNGTDVSSSADTTSSQGEVQSDHKTIIGSEITSGTTTFQISVSQGGQTVNAPNQVFDFMNYRYYGVINSTTEPTKAQVKTLCENGTLTKQLSRSTKMSATDLAANKCYVFVVPNTNVNLIVKNAKSGNPISGCTVDTVTINRVNGTGTVNCKYVIVPYGAAAWTFEITN
jgi:hypothetical protein